MIAKAIIRQTTAKQWLAGIAVALGMFALLGTVAALWENPIFIRMIPADGWETGLLAILSVISGLYVVIRRPFCSNKAANTGGIVGFIAVACPICNKILMLVFGGELLLSYFDPIRIHVALIGVILTLWAVSVEWRKYEIAPQQQPA